MTALQFFEAVLTELNKVKAPSLLLEDYNYFINKGVIQYVNKIYNLYEINQQKTDDLRVLQSSAELVPTLQTVYTSTLYSNIYEVFLPDDYMHILNCVVEYKILSKFKCYNEDDYIHYGAKKLKSDNWSQILTNYYYKPKYNNPYFFISNIEVNKTYPTTDNQTAISNLPVSKESGKRYGNSSRIRMELRFGNNPKFELNKVYIDYIKSPKHFNLTQDQIDNVTDNSQTIEFPDYVINEIINEVVNLVMENGSNPRLQTHVPLTQSISSLSK